MPKIPLIANIHMSFGLTFSIDLSTAIIPINRITAASRNLEVIIVKLSNPNADRVLTKIPADPHKTPDITGMTNISFFIAHLECII